MVLSTMKYFKKKKNKLTRKQKLIFISLLSDLLANGFSIQESLAFMNVSSALPKNIIRIIQIDLEKGEGLTEGLSKIGFNHLLLVQIEFAQSHGNLENTLRKMKEHLLLMDKQQKILYKILIYPSLLVVFLFIVIIGIRQLLLPQLLAGGTVDKQNMGIQLIQNSPYYIGLSLVIGTIVSLSCFTYLKRQSPIFKATILAKIPLLRSIYREYLSAFFALEWGKLLHQGLEIKDVVYLMKEMKQQSIMKDLATDLEKKLILGESMAQQISNFSFFTSEFSFILKQGSMKGKLGAELMMYSELCWQRFFQKMEKGMLFIQPIIFLLIALLIVSVYVSMLLPIYGGMEEFL